MKYMICYDDDGFYYIGEYDSCLALGACLTGIMVETFKTEEEMTEKCNYLMK